jgi:TRAP-type transport system periplasmic protein
MRRTCFSIMVIVVAMLFLPAAPPLNAQEKQPIELKLADWNPPQAKISQLTQKMVDMIHKNSDGRIKITSYFGETLLKQQESFRSTQLGVADISYFGPNAAGSPIVLGKVISLPFLGITSNEMATIVYEKLLQESPEVRGEFKGVKVLGLFGIPLDNFHSVKKAIHTPNDIKGMKIISVGTRAELLKAVGASPVGLGVGDWYTSIERGLVEGLYFLFPVLPIFKIQDLFKYHTVVNASTGVNMFIVNEKKWNSLPPDLQKVVADAAAWRVQQTHRDDRMDEEAMIEYSKSKGQVIYYPTASEMELWHAAAKPVHDKWIADNEGKGLPARKVYDQVVRIVKENTR